MFTQVGVKQLTDFLRTVTVASDFVDCTLVNCELDRFFFCTKEQFGINLAFYSILCVPRSSLPNSKEQPFCLMIKSNSLNFGFHSLGNELNF